MLNSQQQQQQEHRHLQQLQIDHQQQQQNHYQRQQIICGLEPQDLTVSTSIASSIAGIGGIGGGGSGSKSGSDHHLEFLSNANKISSLVISPGAADVGVRQMRNLSDQVHAAAVGGGGGIGIGGNSATSGNNPNSSNSGAKLNSSGSAFFTFNELSKALQQQDQQMNAAAASAISPSSTSSIVFNSSTSPTSGVGGIPSANSNMTSNSSSSSVINSNRIASVSPPTSSHSSNSLNLGNSGSDSPGTVHDHNIYHRHHGMQQHYQHLPILGNLGNNFGLGSVRNNSSGSLSGTSNNPLQHHSQMQRSFSSTSSSIASPPSSISQSQQQHHPFQQQQHQQQPPLHHHHHHHNQQQHHHHHHQPYQPQNSPSSASKSCWCFANSDTTYHFKTLVPAVAAGAIIGKGGETIASLQRDTGARVKMSKSHDFYPGTSERVCLITGSVDAIICVLEFIMEKIREKPDLTTKITDIEAKQSQDRDKQVKILVPNSTAGMIIGKAGAYIKQIKEDSGSYVQISQKPKDITLQERCITIIGEKDNNKIACKMILSKIVEDPQSGTCLNVSYADINGPVANYNPTGSPYASNQAAISSSTASLNTALGNSVGGAGLLVNGTGLNLSLNLGAPNPAPNPAIASQILDHIKVGMRGSGYGESATSEVCSALGILAKYGVLGVGVGLPHTNGAHSAPVSYLGVSALEQSAAAATAASGVFGALGQVNLEQYINQSTAAPRATLEATAQFDAFRHPGPQAATPISINNNSFGLTAATTGATALSAMGALSKSPTPGDLGAKETKNVEIGEGIVGAILGPNGRSLIEIQHVSGANIQISKKGIFAPGTRNRIVTISGQPNAIAMAHFLIETKINEEEAKRARQNPVANVIQ